jgi:hypothetical protein
MSLDCKFVVSSETGEKVRQHPTHAKYEKHLPQLLSLNGERRSRGLVKSMPTESGYIVLTIAV